MTDFNKLFNLHLEISDNLTLQTIIAHDKENYYVIKDISKIEYTNYLKVKNDKLPFLKPLKIAKHGNHTYFLYNYYENHQSIYEAYEGILKTIFLLHKKTALKVPQPKMAEINYKKIALISNDRFNMLEMKIRNIELNPVKNDLSWIYLSKYHIMLDVKLEIYKMIKRLKMITDDIEVGVNHGFPSQVHYFNNNFISYKHLKEGVIENDIYRAYLDFDSLEINHYDIIDKYLQDKYSKKYFKLMVLFSYLLMCDIELNYTCATKYIKLTDKISRFLFQFKEYK